MELLQNLSGYGTWGLVALRLAVGAIFIVHGKAKFAFWKKGATAPMLGLMKFLAIAETLGGLAVLVGFLTQWAAIGLGIIMLGAIKMKIANWKMPFTAMDKVGWEFDLIILAACVELLFMGAGGLSVDRFI